jgi:uncharacterized NAD-dependent epimerase/dehydratase family protein
MNGLPEGKALVYCQGAFNTPNGKTAHGLVRFTGRYQVLSVIDSRYSGKDAGEILDGKRSGIPIFDSINAALKSSRDSNSPGTHLVVGLAPDGGRLSSSARLDIINAVAAGLNIDCGLHDYLSDDIEIADLARQKKVTIRDIRKPPPVSKLHFFSGKIEQVDSLKIAVLGTDSAIGKRTTAWLVVQAVRNAGYKAEMIGTGQTAWMQGAEYGIILDSIINDFIAGEIEHAVWSAWNEKKPDVIVIEGQGSLMNPAYPGGFEILAAGRPDAVILQHAPERKDYDGFPGYPIQPLPHQIKAIETVSGKPVIAITLNHEGINPEQVPSVCRTIQQTIGLPVFDVLIEGADEPAKILKYLFPDKFV